MSVLIGPKIIGAMSGASLGDNYLTEGNTALRGWQALVQSNAISQTATPPGSPNNGDTYIVGVGGIGAWSGKDNQIAYWTTQNLSTAGWDFWTPVEGWKTYNQLTNVTMKFDGSVWVTDSASGITLQVDGIDNADQSILNLVSNDTVSFEDDGSGAVSANTTVFANYGFGGLGVAFGTTTFSSGAADIDVTSQLGFTPASTSNYAIIATYTNPTSSPGTISVAYTSGAAATLHSSNGSDASPVRFIIFAFPA